MFLINDTLEARHQTIRNFLLSDRMIAVILAAADFEWTVRRAILGLGISPTKEIRRRFEAERTSGLKGYKEVWRYEVKPRLGRDLTNIIPKWESFKNAFNLRHRLVHGISGTTGSTYAQQAVDVILSASKALVQYSEEHHSPVYGSRIVRTKPRKMRG
jgi:hypothetical protein